eukprot:gene13315-17838_t
MPVMPVAVEFIVVSFIISISNFIVLIPLIPLIFFKSLKSLFNYNFVTSDIPGNPQAFDYSIISLFSTLPEPSNTNLVWISVPYSRGTLLVKGRLPEGSRCSSLSIYGPGQTQPETLDLSFAIQNKNKEFEVLLIPGHPTDNKHDNNKHILYTKDWIFGFCAMRNYLVPPGSRVLTPQITLLDNNNNNNKIIRDSQIIITEKSSDASQPSSLHTYWIMRYDVTHGEEVIINGHINPSYQKYWSMICYDEYGIPLPQYVNDTNIIINKNNDKSYEYSVMLKSVQDKNIIDDSHHILDVGKVTKGYIIFRLVHPKHEEAINFSAPLTIDHTIASKTKSE